MKHTAIFSSFTLLFLLLANGVLALNPSREYKQLPEKLDMKYEAVSVKTNDGAMLNAWYFPSHVKTTELILICHNGEGNMADYLKQVGGFVDLGFNVMIFDYRGFGKSSDFDIDNNMYVYPHFQDDVKAMIDFCRGKYARTFNMYGFGVGAGLALGIGYNRPEIKRIIADTPFLSMEDLEKKFSSWDTPMEVPFAGMERKFEPIYSLDTEPSKTLQKIMLIIADGDKLMKVDDMKALHKKQPRFVQPPFVVKGSDGTNNFAFDEANYMKFVSKFLKD